MRDSLHNGSTFAFLATAAAAIWFLKGLLAEVRDRAGRRVADWLLPLGHPTTYRMARLALALARLSAPQARTSLLTTSRYYLGSKRPLLPGFNPKLRRQRLDWDDLEAAAAELEVDQRQGAPIAKPLRFVAPLLLRALNVRLANFAARVAFAICVLVVRPCAVAALLLLLLLGWTLRIPWVLGVGVYRKIDLWAAKALLRSAVGRLGEEMGGEERDFWTKAMRWDVHALHGRLILTRRFAVDLWIKGRLRLPSRSSIPKTNWGVQGWSKRTRTELIRAGDEVQFHVLSAARAEERRRFHRA